MYPELRIIGFGGRGHVRQVMFARSESYENNDFSGWESESYKLLIPHLAE